MQNQTERFNDIHYDAVGNVLTVDREELRIAFELYKMIHEDNASFESVLNYIHSQVKILENG